MENIRIRDILRVLINHIRPYKWRMFVVLLGIIISEVALILVPIYYKQLFDGLTAQPPATESILVHTLLIILALHGVNWFLHGVINILDIFNQAQIMANLERTAFANLLKHSFKFFSNNFTGSVVRKVRRLSRAYDQIIDVVKFQFLSLIITIVGSLVVIWFRSHLLVYITGGILGFFIIINYVVAMWKIKYDAERAKTDSEVTGVLADAITNNTNIMLFAKAKHEKGLFHAITEKFRKVQIFTWGIGELSATLQIGLMIVLEFVVMYTAVGLWQQGLLTIGDFALLQGYLVALLLNMRYLNRIIRETYEALADAEEMVEILHTPHDITDSMSAKDLEVSKGSIEFKDINFRYRKTRPVFKEFNLSIKPHEKVALVGPSGSGKTTIVQLILRFHDIQRGKILIDGQSLAEVTQESLRSQIALVPQDPILFHRTLMDNIRYGRLDATDAEVVEAAKQARCHEFITKLPEKYNTYVGERGIKLSGGERQRVAIARAILENTPILILDEATSSLDSESEALIQEALEELMREKTTIVVAHRLSTILKMDRILVMDKGEVVDQGTHDQLIKKQGLYKKLWEIQSSGFTGHLF
jgi:ATP-binding cassette, subfamily B, bacterial